MQFRFGMKTPIPMHHLYPLVAPAATPLYDRMAAAGRLVDWGTGGEATHVPWRTNIKPVLMSSDELIAGIKWLGNNLYSPKYFGERILNLIDMHGRALDKVPYQDTNQATLPLRPVNADTIKLVRQFSRLGPEEMKVWKDVINALSKKPWLTPTIMGLLAIYIQTRYMFEYADMWDQQLVDTKLNLAKLSKTISSPEKILAE